MGEEEISWNLSTVIKKEKKKQEDFFSSAKWRGWCSKPLRPFLIYDSTMRKSFSEKQDCTYQKESFQRDFKVVDKIELPKKFPKEGMNSE